MNTFLITGAELQKAACCNLSESFQTNASVDVAYDDAISGAKQIKLLGLAGKYSQVQFENIPNIRGLATTYGLGYIPGPWMESIQVSKGTASVKNGYESITGQINVEFKKPDDGEKFYLNLYGNNDFKAEMNFNSAVKINDKLSTMVLGHVENKTRETDHNNDGFIDQPLIKQYNIMNRWKYFAEYFRTQIGIKVLQEDRHGGQVSFDDSKERTINNGYGIGVKTNRVEAFFKGAYLLKNRPGTNIAFINSYVYHFQKSFFGLNDYNARENNYYGNLMFQTYIHNTDHQITTGVSYVLDHYDEYLNDSAFKKEESVPGVFAEYTYSIFEKFTLLAGFRVDFNNLYGTLYTPRLHTKYAPNENTIIRVSAGKGYRSPNVISENTYILATSRKLTIKGKQDIEEAWNYGINITKFIDVLGRELTLNADYYRTDFKNQIIVDRDADPQQVLIYNLNGKSFSNSYQIEALYELFNRFDVTAAFRYNDVRMTIDDELRRAPFVNKFKGLLTLSYATNLKKWQFDLTAQLNGDARITDTRKNPSQYQLDEYSPVYPIINAQVSKFFKRWEIYLGGENLTNYKQDNPILASDDPYGKYFDASLVWGPIVGTKIYAGIRYSIKN